MAAVLHPHLKLFCFVFLQRTFKLTFKKVNMLILSQCIQKYADLEINLFEFQLRKKV